MIRKIYFKFSGIYILLFLFTISCSSIPKNTADGCSIFSETLARIYQLLLYTLY